MTIEVRTAAKDSSKRLWSDVVNDVATGTVARLRIPPGKIAGKQVNWRARATTGRATGAWSKWQSAAVPADDVTTAETSSHAAAPPADAFTLLTYWESTDNKLINYRQGYWDRTKDEGFGNVKIKQKHDLDALSAHQMTKHPLRGIVPDPLIMTRYHYLATSYRHKCDGFLWWKECYVAESRNTRTIMDFNRESSKYEGTLGVLTAYCEGMTVCPSWMRASFGAVLLPVPG
ncbi:hypothetical protein [Nonomuraea sp. NEAU-A123]|uniref:hypothetical protein n=1 Tax=Nonomuraea sp. NEAU-A123 TaxID=2839649 RepID=UPI001BE3EA82|nr:hypothetical protein [Nonomuraea sp. NEAU-A123]MBT2230457.1 hypothetical protein [Nonomuraea sp. NEAU-A123]